VSNRKEHWEAIYESKPEDQLSWTQAHPSPSLEWILEALPDRSSRVIDVGGGLSNLVDHLLDAGYRRPAVLDISGAALRAAAKRLGDRASFAEWIEADITTFHPHSPFSLWHDRAVFHFLTSRADREKYLASVRRSLAGGGFLLMATFSPAGPAQCSGLDVMRFDEAALSRELGEAYSLLRAERRVHRTPWGATQEFQHCLFQLRN